MCVGPNLDAKTEEHPVFKATALCAAYLATLRRMVAHLAAVNP
jgi:hypothetical protein